MTPMMQFQNLRVVSKAGKEEKKDAPVGRGGHADTAGADGQGEHLTDDDPCGRAPGGGEGRNVEADERDLGLDGAGVAAGDGRVGGGRADDGDDELADDHGRATDEQDAAASEALDDPERERRREHVHESGDEGDEEGVVDRAKRLEERGTEVEDEVDTGELLRALEA